ncbi:hypothetical protein ACTA71_005064 [Dictyostelium dimigraforme]
MQTIFEFLLFPVLILRGIVLNLRKICSRSFGWVFIVLIVASTFVESLHLIKMVYTYYFGGHLEFIHKFHFGVISPILLILTYLKYKRTKNTTTNTKKNKFNGTAYFNNSNMTTPKNNNGGSLSSSTEPLPLHPIQIIMEDWITTTITGIIRRRLPTQT